MIFGSARGAYILEMVFEISRFDYNAWIVNIGEGSGPWLPKIGVHYLNLDFQDQFSQLNSTR
jgi:hypothetical protein